MIVGVYVDGVKINNEKRWLTRVADTVQPSVDINSYARGGRPGVALSRAVYRNFVFPLEWFIIADDAADLVAQRDALTRYFRLKPDREVDQMRILGLELANGVIKEIPFVQSGFRSDISSADVHTCSMQVTLQTEAEYFTGNILKTKDVYVYEGGGMAIPMPIPMSMANNIGSTEYVLTNAGNAEYYPVITFYGPLDAFELENVTTGKSIAYSTALVSGANLVVDMYNHSAVLNGTINVLDDITGDWWWLAQGDNVIKLTSISGAGYAHIEYKDAYRGV